MAPPNKCLARSNKSRTGIPATNKGPAARRNSLCPPPIGRTRFGGQRCRSFTALWWREVALKLNMSLHHPDLYFFLCLLAGLVAFLAIECIQKFCRPKPPVVEPRRSVEPPSPPKHPPSPFSRLCESIKDLPPEEQASRLHEYFGIVGGARPAEGRRRKGKRP